MDNVTPPPTLDESLIRPASRGGQAVTAVTAATNPTPGGPRP